jgi:hypothetical protein
MKQTAVEWLWNEIDNLIPYQDINKAQQFNGLLEQAKAMEREQMHKCASFWRGKENEIEKPMFDIYYNETYNK